MNASAASAASLSVRPAAWRTLPFLLLLYVLSYLDRTNVAFARIPMSQDLGFSESTYGIASGLFFIGYFVLGIPGALMVEKWGARVVVGFAVVAWGVVTFLFAFTSNAAEFYTLRLLLGLAAAPFFPGVVVHIARSFPVADRSRALAGFIVASPVSLTFAGPVSALMLQISAVGLRSWQWIFIIEGTATILLGLLAFTVLEKPSSEMRSQANADSGGARWWTLLGQRSIFLLCLSYAFANIAGYGFIFWLPSVIKSSIGSSAAAANVVSAVPFGLSAILMWLMAQSSDQTGKYKRNACVPMLGAAAFLLLAVVSRQTAMLSLLWICLAGGFVFAWIPGFWAMPTALATGAARAAAVGLINSVGNLGGFLGPALIGEIIGRTHSNNALPVLVASAYCAAAATAALVRTDPA